MAVSRLKTWIAGETLTASDLNGEFNNVLNNGEDLGWPATKAKDLDAQQLILDGDQDTHITADTDDQIDISLGGFDGVIIDGTTASSVNGFTIATQSTGAAPSIRSRGEANIGMQLLDSNSNEVIVMASTASAVNELTVTNAAAGGAVSLAATGADTDIDLNLVSKGADNVQINGVDVFAGPITGTSTATTSGTAHDYTGIPAWVKKITLMFNEVSLSGTDDFLIQLGDSGGFETTSYVSTSVEVTTGSASSGASSTSGFIMSTSAAGNLMSGMIMIYLADASNSWIASHSAKINTTTAIFGGGSKQLSGTLTQVRLTRTGTDTFDGGSFNIIYE